MNAKRKVSLDVKIALAVFAVVFLVYLFTLCPTIYLGPSADAVCDVRGVGLTPPITHPAWLILGRLFSMFSSNTAFLVNLTSALFGALTIALLYGIASQFIHNRTAEEEARYQVQPYLRQATALSGALLVAFSYPFWEGSVLAGADTLNTFFLVLLVFLAGRYAKTTKARYILSFGLVYGFALPNYPTLLLLAPVFGIFFLVRGRALLDDPVAVVVTLLLFLIGLLPALYLPRTYMLQGKPYVVAATTFGQATSAFVGAYFRSMKELFAAKYVPVDWLAWLFLPTFLPIVFFLMKRGEYEHGSEVATRATYLVRYAFVILFTVGGLGHLWGILFGPKGMADVDYMMDSRYLGSYVAIGAWLSYVLGYWLIVLTGKFKPAGTEPKPKFEYRKISYAIAVIAVLALPMAGMVMNYGKSSKRGAYYVEDFAQGLLQSCPEDAIIIVPGDPPYGSIGAPLRYVNSGLETPYSKGQKIIIDLNAAYLDFYRVKRIDTARYLAETILGRKVDEPRHLFLPEDPFAEAYDDILRCERGRAAFVKGPPRPIHGMANNFLLYLRAENDIMNKEYRAEPAGLLYVYKSRKEYRDAPKIIEDNEAAWARLKIRIKAKGIALCQAEEYIAGECSKSANDLGVFCQLAGQAERAEHYYRRALEWSPDNSSALWNLGSVLAANGKNAEADKLLKKSRSLLRKQREEEPDVLRKFGLVTDFAQLLESERQLAEKEGAAAEARRLGILRLAADIRPDNPGVREKTGDIVFSSALLDEATRRALADIEDTDEERQPSLESKFQEARTEYLAALERTDPKEEPQSRRIMRKLGRVYAKLGENEKAERFLKKALAENDPSGALELIRFYLEDAQNPSAAEELARRIIGMAPADDRDKIRLAAAKSAAANVMVKGLLRKGEADKAKEFLTQYLKDEAQEVDKLLGLAAELGGDPKFDSFTIWLFNEYVSRGKEIPPARLPELADAYFRQKQYEQVVAIKEPVRTGQDMNQAILRQSKAQAYEALGKDAEAEGAFEQARKFLPKDSGVFGIILLNNLAWRYFKNGKLPEAQSLAEEVLRREPSNAVVWDTYGWILYKRGTDFKKAFELIERSFLASPDIGIIAYHYGKLLMEKGQKERGRAVIEMAVASGIDGQEELEDAQNILKTGEGASGGW